MRLRPSGILLFISCLSVVLEHCNNAQCYFLKELFKWMAWMSVQEAWAWICKGTENPHPWFHRQRGHCFVGFLASSGWARPGMPPLQGGLDTCFSATLLPPPQVELLAALVELIDLQHCHHPAALGAVCQGSHFAALPRADNCLFPVSLLLQRLFPSSTVFAPPINLWGN